MQQAIRPWRCPFCGATHLSTGQRPVQETGTPECPICLTPVEMLETERLPQPMTRARAWPSFLIGYRHGQQLACSRPKRSLLPNTQPAIPSGNTPYEIGVRIGYTHGSNGFLGRPRHPLAFLAASRKQQAASQNEVAA